MTAAVTPAGLNKFIKADILPIFVIRNITNSKLIGKWDNTTIHFRELAPTTGLYQAWRDKLISQEEFEKRYLLELIDFDLQWFTKRLEQLVEFSNANSIVIMGYGDYETSNRKVLSTFLNNLGIFEKEIKEIKL